MTNKELSLLVKEYCEHQKDIFENKINAFKKRPFKQVVATAANGAEWDGTKNTHLHWLWSPARKPSLKRAAKILIGKNAELKRCKNFQELHDLITTLVGKIRYIGPVYCYDVALRIGAYNGRLPKTKVYVHAASVRQAACELGFNINADYTVDWAVSRLKLPSLNAWVTEDFLCDFKKL